MKPKRSIVRAFSNSETIDLCCQDEVAFCQAVDLMGPDSYFGAAPTEADVRMMPLLFCQLTHAVYELKCLCEITKLVFLAQVVLVDNLPSRNLTRQFGKLVAFQWRDTAAARNAIPTCQVTHVFFS